MTKAERIADIRSKPYNQCTYDELLWALDELEKATAVVERVREWRDYSRAVNPISHWDGEHIAFNLDRCLAPLDGEE